MNLTASFSSHTTLTLSIVGCTTIRSIIQYLEVIILCRATSIESNNEDHFVPVIIVEKHQRFFTPQVNRISLRMPSSPPLSQYHALPSDSLCNISTVANCKEKQCACAYTLQIPLGSLVEVIIIDEGIRIGCLVNGRVKLFQRFTYNQA